MKSQSSKLLVISVVVVLGTAAFVMRGGGSGGTGILASIADVPVASAAAVDTSKSVNVAGDKAWEVIGGPVKVGNAKTAAEPKGTTATASAPMKRLPW